MVKRLRFGAALHFLIAIGHIACLFALDEAFEARNMETDTNKSRKKAKRT